MLYKILKISFIAVLSIIFISCSASTGSRYDKKEEESVKKESESVAEIKFDMTRYHSAIDVDEDDIIDNTEAVIPDIWYEYSDMDTSDLNNRTILERTDGYRVQVLSTDNLDDANNVRSDLYFKTNQKNVYIIFDPPFYKVKVGDILNLAEANELNFKLSQMGYTESRVVKDSINIFQ